MGYPRQRPHVLAGVAQSSIIVCFLEQWACVFLGLCVCVLSWDYNSGGWAMRTPAARHTQMHTHLQQQKEQEQWQEQGRVAAQLGVSRLTQQQGSTAMKQTTTPCSSNISTWRRAAATALLASSSC